MAALSLLFPSRVGQLQLLNGHTHTDTYPRLGSNETTTLTAL